MRNSDLMLSRISEVMQNDRMEGVRDTMRMLENDLFRYLDDFVRVEELSVCLNAGEGGSYQLNISAKCSEIYKLGKIITRS